MVAKGETADKGEDVIFAELVAAVQQIVQVHLFRRCTAGGKCRSRFFFAVQTHAGDHQHFDLGTFHHIFLRIYCVSLDYLYS